jgi:hypothetical protein
VRTRRALAAACVALLVPALAVPAVAQVPDAVESVPDLRAPFEREVQRRLALPEEEQRQYAQRLDEAFARAGLPPPEPQYVLVVDRSPRVQASFLYWRSPANAWHFTGATQVSTGRPGSFEHFLTPTGVFEHSLANPDFRAEGTRNEFGVRGYGRRGMRVFDFGWVSGERGWGAGGVSPMRLQVHATDPELLEPRLGETRSKGCIRIPASLNEFLDRRGVLDAEYFAAFARGDRPWILRPDRDATRWPGRYLVIVDSERAERPAWASRPTPAPPRKPSLGEGTTCTSPS